MQQLIEKLKMYANQIDLTTRFDYRFNTLDSLFTSHEIQALSDEQNLFFQNVRLKSILKEKYENTIEFDSLDFWIINDWGGIRSFKPTGKNKEKIKSFRKQLTKRRLSKDSFSTISSLSKLSSFNDPDNFVIYDSRVIYSLNWLILTCENQKSIKVKYFPMPSGRNRIISDFDMNTILNLFHLSEYSNGESLYISYQQAYFDFCDFVKSTTTKVFGSDSKPYELEMLLFTMADREIFEDIKGKTKIVTAKTVHKTNIRTSCMIKLADIYPSRNGKPKVDFFLLGIYDLLKTQLGFRYAKFDGKGNYLKAENGVYKIVNFHKLRDDFRNYISDNFEELEASKEIGLDDFMNEYYKKTPIKDGNYAREYLAEDFELSDYNKHIIRLEINEKYRRHYFRNEMLEFLKQENFIEFNDELKTLNLTGPLFYKQSKRGYFLVFNNPFHGGKVISTVFDLHKVDAKSQKEFFNKKAKKSELIKIAFDLQTDVDLIRET